MCRFVMYLGPKISLSSLVTEPSHSIIHQSIKAKELEEPLNGDGFGVAWYAPELSDEPAIFKDVSPAWNNQNLLNLAPVVESRCLLAHVRAATPGLPVSQLNCHPFGWKNLAFMHNGHIEGFAKIRRKMRNRLSDAAYQWVKGSTDTEHLFGLFIDEFSRLPEGPTAERIFRALQSTIRMVEEMSAGVRGDKPSQLNLVVTDGNCAVVTRFSSDDTPPNTLYINSNRSYQCDDEGEIHLEKTGEQAVLVASEPLTDDSTWTCVNPDHAVIIDEQRQVSQQPLDINLSKAGAEAVSA